MTTYVPPLMRCDYCNAPMLQVDGDEVIILGKNHVYYKVNGFRSIEVPCKRCNRLNTLRPLDTQR